MLDYKKDIEANKLSNQRNYLRAAIGRRILEIERFFVITSEEFLEYRKNFDEERDYFSLNQGATKFLFEGNLTHAFKFFSANSPIIKIPDSFTTPYAGDKYQLSKIEHLASEKLKNCLGNICEDVRIWMYSLTEELKRREKAEGFWTLEMDKEFEQEEEDITDSGVSYLLSNGDEIIYCCNFYNGELNDSLTLIQDIRQEYVHSCFSLKQDKYIIEPKSPKSSDNLR